MQKNQLRRICAYLGTFMAVLALCCVPCKVFASDAGNSGEANYEFISFGDVGNSVLELQTRLMELKYFHDEIQLTPTVYDSGTQEAVECFCECNGVSYSGTGVNAALQRLIYAQGAIPYSEPEENLTISQKLSAYMVKDVPMFGLRIPMFVVWICSGILIILILFLLVYFFVPEKRSTPSSEAAPVPMQYWHKSAFSGLNATVMTQEKAHGAMMQKLEIQLRYNGKSRLIVCSCPPVITVGRRDCAVILDGRDKMVSGNHCEFYLRGAIWMIKDHSTNGTRLNGRMLHNTECRINSGDQIVIGSHELIIQ